MNLRGLWLPPPVRVGGAVEACHGRRGRRGNGRLATCPRGANRVLHLAFREGHLLGCCSSTLQPPWTPWTEPLTRSCGPGRTCGHWGLLSVHPDAQGTGVASALIAAAERRLLEEGCSTSAEDLGLGVGRCGPDRVRVYLGRP